MAWLNFIICLLLGCLGVHKFREKKIGMGLLYLFTAGLFGIGWIYDCCKYYMIAQRGKNSAAPSATQEENRPDIRNVLLWVLTVYLAIFCLTLLPKFTGFIALLVIAIVIPIEKWQSLLRKFMKGWVKAITAGVLAIIMIFTIPANTPTSNDPASLQNPITVTEEFTADVFGSEAPTEEITEAPTETPTQPETETPTEAPTEKPTEPPTETPTEKPTEPPTEAPTVSPVTDPMPESTEAPTNPPATDPPATEPPKTEFHGTGYILNKNSNIFHYPDCPSVDRMSEKNKVEFYGTRDEAIDKGYTPCKNCNP